MSRGTDRPLVAHAVIFVSAEAVTNIGTQRTVRALITFSVIFELCGRPCTEFSGYHARDACLPPRYSLAHAYM